MTAEGLEDFLCYYSSITLKNLVNEHVRILFIELKNIWQCCKSYEFSEREINTLNEKIIAFIKRYERYYVYLISNNYLNIIQNYL